MAPPSPNEPRTELGKNFSKKIEVASLAIRASSVQSSLFPEQPPALPTIQHRPQRRAATDEDSDMRHLLDTTRSALMAVEKKGPASPKKAVTFSNTPVVHSIETFVDEDSEDSEKEEMDTETETETETEEDTDYDDEDEDEDEEENTERHHQSQQQELERHMEYDDEDNLMDVISGIASISSHPPPQQSQPPTSSPIFSAPSFNPQRRSFANLPHRLPRDEVLHELSRQRQYIPSMPSSSRNYSDPFLSRRSSTSMDHHLEPIENQIMQAIMRIKASTSQNQDKAHASVASSPPPSQPTPVHRQSVPGNSTLALLTKYPSLLSPQQRQHHAQHNHHSSNGTRVPMPPGTPPPTPPSQKPTLLPSVSPPPPPSTPPPQFPAPPPIEDEESITESETITQECHTPDDKKEKQNVLPSLPKQQFADFGVSLLGEMNRITSEKNVQQQKLQRDQVKQCTKKDSEKQQGPHVALTYKPASEKEKLMMTQTLEKKEDHDPPAATLVWRTVRADEKSHQQVREPVRHGRLFVRIVAAENLDFPIDPDAPAIRCVLHDGETEYASSYRPMAHTISFDHEFCFDMDHDDEFTLTLQTAREPNQLRRIFSTQRLARYINRSDGALAQARVAFRDVEPRCRSRLCNASFALVNSWYRPLRPHLMKRNIREKAVGKITVSLFFLPAKAGALAYPTNLQGCEQIVNMQRYYRTCWQSGCMFQKGADLKFWKKRFFRLKGWRLFSYTEAREARAMIDLSKASALVADHRVISHRSWQPHGSTEVTISPVKNSFHVVFENGEKIEFFCDSARERGRWLDVLKIAVDCQLQWPGWVSPEDDEADEDEDLHPAVDYGPVKDQEVPVAAI